MDTLSHLIASFIISVAFVYIYNIETVKRSFYIIYGTLLGGILIDLDHFFVHRILEGTWTAEGFTFTEMIREAMTGEVAYLFTEVTFWSGYTVELEYVRLVTHSIITFALVVGLMSQKKYKLAYLSALVLVAHIIMDVIPLFFRSVGA